MAKSKSTKAVLITSGDGQKFELLKKDDVLKETFSEGDFDKSSTVLPVGEEFLGNTVKTETIKIGDQDAHLIAFEDGMIYQVGKGFIPGDHKADIGKIVKKLTPAPEKKVAAPAAKAKIETAPVKDADKTNEAAKEGAGTESKEETK